jgi:hypothetical protein
MGERVGNRQDATEAMWHWLTNGYHGERAREIGRGEDRTAYLVNGVVYKVGIRPSANRDDHDTLSSARAAGMPWAPQTSLYELVDNYGDPCPVLAMPYLPDDGSVPDPALLAEMHAQTGGQVDRIGGNYVVRAGQPIVIDGCTVAAGAWA